MRITRPGVTLGATLLALAPALAADVAHAQYPTQPPAGAAVKPAAFPPFQEATLANGVRVVLVENHRDPVVAFRLAIPAGSLYSPKGKEGTADMVASLLTKGAGQRSADEIAAAIEGVGGSLSGFAGSDYLSIAGNTLSNAAPLAFQLLGDAVARPTFPESEIELLRTQTLSALQLEQSQPGAIASRVFNAGLYGNHPYGRRPTPASVRGITRADLVAFQQARLKPRGALLVVAGDITMAQVRQLAEQAFAGWTGYPAPAPALASPPGRTQREIVLVHRPGSVQSNIVVGNLTTGPADPTRYAATVANKLLGGGSDARLFTILREQKGWTYGSYSSLTRPRGTGAFSATAEVRTDVTDSALVELTTQLTRLGREAVGAQELENAKGALVGSFPLTVETAEQIAEQVAQVKTLGLPADYLQTYRTRLAAVSAPQLQQVARSYVRPEQALVVVVGDGTKLHDRLAKLGRVRIVSPQGDALTAADLAPAAGPVALDFSKLVARRDSFAFQLQGNAVGYLVNVTEKAGDGWKVSSETNVMGGMIRQTSSATTDARLAVREVTGDGSMQGQPTKTQISYAGGRAKGSTVNPTPQGMQAVTVDAAVPADAMEASVLGLAVPLMKWSANQKYVVNVFNPGKNAASPVTLTASAAPEKVTVPAGTFDAWRIEQTGGEQAVTMYVSTEATPRLVKIVPAGPPVEVVLVK